MHSSAERVRKQVDAAKKRPSVNTAAIYKALSTKYKPFLDFLHENIKIDELNKTFETFVPEDGTILYRNYDPTKIAGLPKVGKSFRDQRGQESP